MADKKEEKKKTEIKKTFEGKLNFDNVDPHCARFKMDIPKDSKGSQMYGNRSFQITPEMFPKDFEQAKYDVTGSFKFEVTITEK